MITVYCSHCGIKVKMYRATHLDLDDLKAYHCKDSCGQITYIEVKETRRPRKVKGIRNLKKFQQ